MANVSGGGFGYQLLHTAQLWRTEFGAALSPHALTVPQFLLMMALYRQHRHGWASLTQAQVAVRLGMDANTTSQIARALEHRALLRRGRHPDDARARALDLTPDGVERAAAASATAHSFNELFFGVLDPEQQELFGSLLHTLSLESEKRS